MDQRAFGRLGAPTDNFAPAAYRTTVEDMPAVWVGRTYMLGRVRDTASSTTREVRPEFFNDDLVVSGLTSAELTSVDPYTHYSFAMALKRARLYTAGTVIVPNPPPPAVPTNLPNFTSSLFELRIMVYRHFDQTAADTLAPPFAGTLTGGSIPLPKGNAPVAEFVSMVAN
jgi:hypothetical protein